QLRAEGSALSIASPAGVIEVTLRVGGEHNVHNALAATAATLALDAPLAAIRRGLEGFGAVSGRGVTTRLRNGALLIDDSYNANPDSVRAAIDLLARAASPRVLVLGDMGEVGDQGPEFHREIGAYARQRAIDGLLCLGEATRASVAAFGGGATHCRDVDELI